MTAAEKGKLRELTESLDQLTRSQKRISSAVIGLDLDKFKARFDEIDAKVGARATKSEVEARLATLKAEIEECTRTVGGNTSELDRTKDWLNSRFEDVLGKCRENKEGVAGNLKSIEELKDSNMRQRRALANALSLRKQLKDDDRASPSQQLLDEEFANEVDDEFKNIKREMQEIIGQVSEIRNRTSPMHSQNVSTALPHGTQPSYFANPDGHGESITNDRSSLEMGGPENALNHLEAKMNKALQEQQEAFNKQLENMQVFVSADPRADSLSADGAINCAPHV